MIVTTSEATAALRIQRGSCSVTIHPNGSVELTPGVTLDHAAKLFWDAVEKNFPHDAAVKAERERCANIAKAKAHDLYVNGDTNDTTGTCEEIMLKILSGA